MAGIRPIRSSLAAATALGVVVLFAVQLLPSAASFLSYERSAIADGELWRLWTAHLVHLGPSHTALNAGALIAVFFVVGNNLRVRTWLTGFVITAPLVTGALWLFTPNLTWYVGLSGMLHGLIVVGAMASLERHRTVVRVEATALLIAVAAKIAWEQWAGAMPASTEISGGRVIVDAHLFGAISGALWGAVMQTLRRARSRQGARQTN